MGTIHYAEYDALERLSETGGFPAGEIAFMIHGKRDRSHSAIMSRTMRGLEVKGLVAKLDDQKPICWVRTPLGSKRLAEKRPAPSTEEASHG